MAEVQLANGSQGWVKASYLTSEAPALRRLQERIAEIDKLHKDISRLESELAAARVAATPAAGSAPRPAAQTVGSGTPAGANTADRIAANTARNTGPAGGDPGAADTPDKGAAAATPPPEEREGTGLMALGTSRSQWPSSAWGWLMGSSAVALILGFVFGWKTLDRRIREKYGGLRIY